MITIPTPGGFRVTGACSLRCCETCCLWCSGRRLRLQQCSCSSLWGWWIWHKDWWRSLGETNDWHQRYEKKLRFGFQLCLFNGAGLMRFCLQNCNFRGRKHSHIATCGLEWQTRNVFTQNWFHLPLLCTLHTSFSQPTRWCSDANIVLEFVPKKWWVWTNCVWIHSHPMFQLVDICANGSGQCIQKKIVGGCAHLGRRLRWCCHHLRFWGATAQSQTNHQNVYHHHTFSHPGKKKGVNCKTSIQQNPLPTSEVETTLCYQIVPFAITVCSAEQQSRGLAHGRLALLHLFGRNPPWLEYGIGDLQIFWWKTSSSCIANFPKAYSTPHTQYFLANPNSQSTRTYQPTTLRPHHFLQLALTHSVAHPKNKEQI